tara:strand:- start:136 stop:492 length:357 start_codon:yes stop_codon:yes gene_type:complete
MKFKSLITTILVFLFLSLLLYSFFDKQKEILEPLENENTPSQYCEKRTEMVLKQKAETDKILSSVTQISELNNILDKQIKDNEARINTNKQRIDNIQTNVQKQLQNPTKGESIPEIKR